MTDQAPPKPGIENMMLTRETEAKRRIGHVAVFCGSRLGARSIYTKAVAELGRGLAERGIGLIYGGGRIGLMGCLADAALDAGGAVVGIIPDFLSAREVAHSRVAELVTTDSMHTRKQLMFDRADAFVSMPGGLGTLDETIEVVTWRQLDLHDKPILIVDVGGWARGFVAAMETAISDGFADLATRELYDIVPDVASALHHLEFGAREAPSVSPARL